MNFNLLNLMLGFILGSGPLIITFIFYKKALESNKKKKVNKEVETILNRAKNDSSKMMKEAERKSKDMQLRVKRNAEWEIKKQKEELKRQDEKLKSQNKRKEKELLKREETLEGIKAQITKKEENFKARENRILESEKEVKGKILDLTEKLKGISNLSTTEAREEIKKAMEEEAKNEASKMIFSIEEDARQRAEQKAKRIISMAIARYAGEFTAEKTVTSVSLPNEEIKGKIIGREGRNIRTIESLCGVDLIVDEVPETVLVSGFDPVRKEVAKRALETLMEDGRIHPGRIEEVVDKVKKNLFKFIKTEGERACLELGLQGVHTEIQKTLGSLKFRTSYSQNNFSHSLEVGMLAGLMASELGVNVKLARRAGLFHDLGKAMDHSIEGSHAIIGAELAKKYGETEEVCHAIRAHHEDEKPRTLLAYLVMASDAISSARPGARKSMAENYIQRLEDLESIANSFDGVERTFAIQAGREIRVIVDSSRVTDEQSVMLSRDIARKIEKEMKFPGQIKISVVRETRAIEHAR